MCGITAYCGQKKAIPFLLNGLKQLEYRGYDSAGISVLNNESLLTKKCQGRIKNLENILDKDIHGYIGIGHTRWATHGSPSYINAHPHNNQANTFSIVHNGIIENYQDLKIKLIKKGYTFQSQTDSEVIVQLLDYYYQDNVFEAFKKMLQDIKGSYAICMICSYDKDHVYIAKKESPLIIGKTSHGYLIASDIPALLDYTHEVSYLDDFECAIVSKDNIQFYNQELKSIEKNFKTITYQKDIITKDGYDTFMLKEINEQPQAIEATLKGRIHNHQIIFEELKDLDFHSYQQVYFVACGSAYHACLYGSHILQKLINIPVQTFVASEFRYNDPLLSEKTLTIFVSQSGETADTLAALRLARAKKATTIAIANVIGSTLAREADYTLYTYAGVEQAVASSKAYITQLVILLLLAYFISQQLFDKTDTLLLQQIQSLSHVIENILKDCHIYEKFADKIKDKKDIYFIGRSLDYVSALEGSLKLKEVSYIHSDAYMAGELKHGPIALIEEGTIVIAIASQPHIMDKTMNNIEETISRGANVILLTTQTTVNKNTYTLPSLHPFLQPFCVAVVLQFIAYKVACLKGLDVDKPRNLAKSVTVE